METQKIDLHSDTESEDSRGEIRAHIIWKGKHHPIFEGENIIGREDDCDVIIDHDSVAPKHATLDFEDGVAKVRDFRSNKGTSLELIAGSGNFVKLGPHRRYERVNNGCKIRFGLIECKYTEAEVEAPVVLKEKSHSRYDLETQMVNLAPLDESEDEDEDRSEGGIHAYSGKLPPIRGGSGAFDRLASRSSVLEQETQLEQDLNSAEKAPIHRNESTPSSIFGAHLTHGIASGGVESPLARSGINTPDTRPLTTAASTGTKSGSNSTPSPAPLPIALRDTTPATAVGDDDCSTEDDGLNDFEDHHDYVPINIPCPAFHPVASVDEPPSDSDDDDMSQDLMPADREEEGEKDEEAEIGDTEKVEALLPIARTFTSEPVVLRPQEEIAADDEIELEELSADFKLAQEDIHPDNMDAFSGNVPMSRAASWTNSTGQVATSDSPFHNLASADSRLDAPMDIAQDEIPIGSHSSSSTAAQVQELGRSSHVQELEPNTEPQEFFTAQDPPGQGHSSLSLSSTSPTISGSERQRTVEQGHAPDLRTSVRSPGAAIKDLLKNSAIPEGLKIFRSQGGLVDGSESPAMSSAASSLPADAPSMHFDFGAAVKASGSSTALPAAQPAGSADAEEEQIVVQQAAKPKTGRGRKRIWDDEDEEFDEVPSVPVPVPVHVFVPVPTAEPKSSLKKARTNPRSDKKADATEKPEEPSAVVKTSKLFEAAVTSAVAPSISSSSAPATTTKLSGRGRKTPSPLTTVEEGDAHGTDDGPSSTAKKTPAAKRGRGKAAAAAAAPAEEEAEADTTAIVPTIVEATKLTKTPAKSGRCKESIVKEMTLEEPLPSSSDETVPQIVNPVIEEILPPKSAAKQNRGKGKGQTDAESNQVLADPIVPDANIVEAVASKSNSKKGRGKSPTEESFASAAAEALDPQENVPATSGKLPAKKGKSKTVVVEEEPVDAPPLADLLVEDKVAEDSKKPSKGRVRQSTVQNEIATPSAGQDVEMERAAVPTFAKKGTKRAAVHIEEPPDEVKTDEKPAMDEAVRIMFTKVDESPYLKAIKSMPNVSVTSDATEATHCVTLAELKRTPKLMVALNCGVKYVVTEQWMKDCVKAKSIVDVVKTADGAAPKKAKKNSPVVVAVDPRADTELVQLLRTSPYIVQDAEKEKLWGFSMASTLAIPRNNSGPRLFERLCFFCTKGVCGETAPPADEMRAIIESGGGQWLDSLDEWNALTTASSGANSSSSSSSTKTTKGKTSKGPQETEESAGQVLGLVVISHASVVKKEVNKKVVEAVGKGDPNISGVCTIEFVFLACLKQLVDFEAHRLK